MRDSAGLPGAFAEWPPWVQATALGLATFVQEDIPTVTAALLAATGQLPLWVGFLGCFLGIWIGDALLYGAARGFGRPLLEHSWTRRWVSLESVARSEQWFAEKGTWLLLSSRFIPGTRLPTYLAAGFLRLSFPRFLLVTGAAVAVWTLLLFGLAHLLGSQLRGWLDRWNSVVIWVVLGAVLIGGMRWLVSALQPGWRFRGQAAWSRWRHWEFWPAWLFYLPVGVWYVILACRHRGLTVPTAANPGMETGGFVGESKFATLRDLQETSPEFTATTGLLPAGSTPEDRWERLRNWMQTSQLDWPIILKPDVGQRGMGVKVIRSEADARRYLGQSPAAIVMQEYVPGPLEVGIFYYRFPHETKGRIFAVTEKIFPELTGDGIHTVEELIWRDPRARCVAERYLTRFATRTREVLPPGTSLRLVEAGNHAQGCIFCDGVRFRTAELVDRIDDISQRVSGFFIGRYDVRFASEEDLRAGRNFQILELNGAAAEATHIYDARNTLGSAYRTLFEQWSLVFAIGAANRARGFQPDPPAKLWRTWRAARSLFTAYPPAD
jgi:membrane protein DedA with SNARE-associated domain